MKRIIELEVEVDLGDVVDRSPRLESAFSNLERELTLTRVDCQAELNRKFDHLETDFERGLEDLWEENEEV